MSETKPEVGAVDTEVAAVEEVALGPWPSDLPVEEEPEVDAEALARAEARAKTERALQHRAEMWVEMAKTDACKELLLEMERKQMRMNANFAARLRAGEAVDQRQVDYDRGFIDALAYPAEVLKAAEATLKKLDAKAAVEESKPDDDQRGGW